MKTGVNLCTIKTAKNWDIFVYIIFDTDTLLKRYRMLKHSFNEFTKYKLFFECVILTLRYRQVANLCSWKNITYLRSRVFYVKNTTESKLNWVPKAARAYFFIWLKLIFEKSLSSQKIKQDSRGKFCFIFSGHFFPF